MIAAKPVVVVSMLALAGGAVAQQNADEARIANLVEQLATHPGRASDALMSAGDRKSITEACFALNEAVQGRPFAVQADALFLDSMLGNLSRYADFPLGRLEERLREDPPPRQLAVLARIMQLGPKAAETLPQLHRLLELGGTGWSVRTFGTTTGGSKKVDLAQAIRRAAAEAMIRVAPAATATINAYGYLLLQDRDANTRFRIVVLLGQQGQAAASAVPCLRQVLEDSPPRVRAETITALGMIGPAAKDAIPELEKLTDHEDKQIAERAKAALRQIRRKQ